MQKEEKEMKMRYIYQYRVGFINVKRIFFPYNTNDYRSETFDIVLPNNKVLKMKVAQSGGKALMSNPNSALGKWILRDILKLEKNILVTKEMLDIIGIDSVKLSKMSDGSFFLDFLKSGSFEKFKIENYETRI